MPMLWINCPNRIGLELSTTFRRRFAWILFEWIAFTLTCESGDKEWRKKMLKSFLFYPGNSRGSKGNRFHIKTKRPTMDGASRKTNRRDEKALGESSGRGFVRNMIRLVLTVLRLRLNWLCIGRRMKNGGWRMPLGWRV